MMVRLDNLTHIVERAMQIYAATLGISPQAFTDDAVFSREANRLAQAYYAAQRAGSEGRADGQSSESEVEHLIQ